MERFRAAQVGGVRAHRGRGLRACDVLNRISDAEGKAWVLSVERIADVGDSAPVKPDGDDLVQELGKRRWRVKGDPEDDWWVEVDSDGSELPGDWEYDPESGCVYCSVG